MNNKLYKTYILILIFFVISCNNNKVYKSLRFVPENQKAWIPNFLNNNNGVYENVYNYFECHDLDTNETWGYFSIDIQTYNLKFGNELSDYNYINKKKLEKQILKLGCSEKIEKGHFFQYENSVFFLIFDNTSHKFYFFGKYQ